MHHDQVKIWNVEQGDQAAQDDRNGEYQMGGQWNPFREAIDGTLR
jgi:hypothetical protein